MNEISVEKAGKVASVVIDRPPVNALTMALYQRIAEVFEEIGTWDDVNCAVLSARGSKAFCAGLDLREFLAAKVEDDPARAVIVRRMFHSVRHCKIPVIAAGVATDGRPALAHVTIARPERRATITERREIARWAAAAAPRIWRGTCRRACCGGCSSRACRSVRRRRIAPASSTGWYRSTA